MKFMYFGHTKYFIHSLVLNKFNTLISIVKQSLKGEDLDYTTLSIRRSVALLAIPMMLEMLMESVFALVDLYFVGHLPNSRVAIQTVGLTESVLTIIYSLAMGLSMAATAVVARRVGEKNPEAAGKAGMQTIFISLAINVVLSVMGVVFATDILLLMGASQETALEGTPFIRIMMGGSTIIVLLFLINGIFRGAGNAAIAMKSLWIANIANIILCPILINGVGPFEGFGLTGAAIATTIGRSIGVSYQLYHLFSGRSALKAKLSQLAPDWKQVIAIIKIAAPGVFQFVIASCSWIFLAKLVANSGGEIGSAGYQTALRLMMFFMLPAWGLSNAAATLVGQNMGANRFDRAEESVRKTIRYNGIFMACVMILFLTCGDFFVSFFTSDPEIIKVADEALKIMSLGFVIYGVGMVLVSAFNGAGDTWTPTWINIAAFWCFQIPFAYILSDRLDMGVTGVFVAIPVAEVLICLIGYVIFRRGNWKGVKV